MSFYLQSVIWGASATCERRKIRHFFITFNIAQLTLYSVFLIKSISDYYTYRLFKISLSIEARSSRDELTLEGCEAVGESNEVTVGNGDNGGKGLNGDPAATAARAAGEWAQAYGECTSVGGVGNPARGNLKLQCQNCKIFQSLRFYVKLNMLHVEASITTILTILEAFSVCVYATYLWSRHLAVKYYLVIHTFDS